MPAMKICEKLKKMDSQICELKYGIMESSLSFPRICEILPILETSYFSKKSLLEGKKFSIYHYVVRLLNDT